jgi:outer membrane immunogenic protein
MYKMQGLKDSTPVSGTVVGGSWSGAYIGLHGGYEMSKHDLGATVDYVPGVNSVVQGTGGLPATAGNMANGSLNGVNADGYFGGINGGYDWQRGSIVFGVRGDYSWSGAKSETSLALGGDTVATADITKNDEWRAGARVGYLMSPNVLGYVHGGYQQSNLTYHLDIAGGDPWQKNVTADGAYAGIGAEWKITPNVYVFSEYSHFWGSKETIAAGTLYEDKRGVVTGALTDEIGEDSVRLGVRVKADFFGGK